MRVTNSMITGRVIFNTQNSLNRFLNLQTQMSTGKKINKPSDDPLGITRDLEYRKELSNNAQYQNNVSLAQSWGDTTGDALYTIQQQIADAKEIAVNAADETYSGSFPDGIEQFIDSILTAGNSQLSDRYIFSGFKTDTPALREHPNGMSFEGDNGSIKYQIDSSVDVGVNMDGASIFFKQIKTLGDGFDLNTAINGSTQLDDLHGGNGINQTPGLIQIRDVNLGITATIDLNTETNIDQVLLQINNDLVANGITNLTARISDTNNSLMFESTPTGIISGDTPLDNINSGTGVNMNESQIRVTDGAGIDVKIDLESARTIDEVITEFNSQMMTAGVFNVTMGINAAGTGLEINDTNGVPLNLKIEDLNVKSNLAGQLGILGTIDPSLTGKDLNPQVHFAIEEFGGGTTAEDLGILDEFNSDFIGNDLDAQLLTSANLNELNNGLGLDLGEITLWQGGSNAIIDLDSPSIVTVQDMLDAFNNSGLDITATLNDTNTGIQVVSNDLNSSFTIEEVGSGNTAKSLGIYGSSDMIGSMYVLNNAMKAGAQEEVGLMLENMDLAHDQALNYGAINSSKSVRLENTSNRLYAQEFMFTARLSDLEDADLTKVITDLSIYENNYQAALMASAKLIQPSLLNFLR